MKFRLFFLCFQLQFSVVISQTVSGIVKDAASGERLPYVSIGVKDKNMGVISRDDGRFEIVLKGSPDDVLGFSMVGYETKYIRIDEVTEKFIEVSLKRKVYQLKEVVFTDRKSKPVKLGRYQPTKTTSGHSGHEEFGWGGEWGLKILYQGKKSWIEAVAFHLRFNTLDSILFRINVYTVRGDLPNESILKKELFVKSYKRNKWIIKDLVSENLVMEEDLIVTFEVVRLWYSKSGGNHLFFTHGLGYEQGKTYSRQSSFDRWAINGRPPVTMYLSVTEY